MTYLQTNDFKLGMDRTRERYVGTPGALWTLKNGHITRGGDVERMKKFVPTYALPPGTFGMGQVRNQLYVFGSSDLAGQMPAAVQYQRLTNGAANMTRVLDVRSFDGKLYVIAAYDDGQILHFYNGAQVTTWTSTADQNTSFDILCSYMADLLNTRTDVSALSSSASVQVMANTPGTPFAIAVAYTDGGGNGDQTVSLETLVANVPAVSEVAATGTLTVVGGTEDPGLNQILSASVGGVALISGPIDWQASNEATAIRLQKEINNQTSAHGYAASVSGATVTISARPGAGASANGAALAIQTAGNVQATTSGQTAGGVSAVAPVAQISLVRIGGTFEPLDRFTIAVNGAVYTATGRAAGMGTSAHVFKKKLWSPAGSLYAYSEVDNPANFAPNNSTGGGGGFINMANQTEGSERLVSAAEYNGNVAIFARRTVRIWTLDADPTRNAFLQTLENVGTVAPRSVTKYGNQDVFFLSDSGVRSIRARDASNAAVADDVGTRIDSFIQEYFQTLTADQQARACGIVEPIDGRYLVAVGSRVFVFSYFPSLKISAWSYYEPGFEISDFVQFNRKLYARSGNTIYLYGGPSGAVYPDDGELPCEVETPFVSAGTPATIKALFGFDLACVNEWEAQLLIDPNDTSATVEIGRITGPTYNSLGIPTVGRGGVFAMRFVCARGGRAVLSAAANHFTSGDAK